MRGRMGVTGNQRHTHSEDPSNLKENFPICETEYKVNTLLGFLLEPRQRVR